MESVSEFFQTEQIAHIYGASEILLNLTLAFALGMVISWVYKTTHKGLSYSQSFLLTTIFVTVIVSMVIMIIGNNLARAFALVGALSIIRFRTVVKDTKDTAYVFWGLAAGMAAGTSSYFLAIAGVAVMSTIAIVLHQTNYGTLYKSEFILRFRSAIGGDTEPEHLPVLEKYAKSSTLLHVEPSGDGKTVKLTMDIIMKPDTDPGNLSAEISQLDGVSEVVLVASKTDVDY
jgi:uncharacterized membrane protein YhiD involved in acid resistance